MKTQIRLQLFLIAFLLSTITLNLAAQTAEKELADFTKAFQETYNKGNATALTVMFATDAVQINLDGSTVKGAATIEQNYTQTFKGAAVKSEIKVGPAISLPNGKIVGTGTYTVTGTSKADGKAVNFSGSYENTCIKENGTWKILVMNLLYPVPTTPAPAALEQEMTQSTKNITDIYNKADAKAITALFTADAKRFYPDGGVVMGTKAIEEDFSQGFSSTMMQKMTLVHSNTTRLSDTKVVVKDTFTITGTSKADGKTMSIAGSAERTMVKENGTWKISQLKGLTGK